MLLGGARLQERSAGRIRSGARHPSPSQCKTLVAFVLVHLRALRGRILPNVRRHLQTSDFGPTFPTVLVGLMRVGGIWPELEGFCRTATRGLVNGRASRGIQVLSMSV